MTTFPYCFVAMGLLAGAARAQAPRFAAPLAYSVGVGRYPASLAVADVNGDGKPDVLTANATDDTAGVLLGNGDGTFQIVAYYATGGSGRPMGLTMADVNGDGKLDLLVANFDSSTAGVLLGNGDGTFQTVRTYSTGLSTHPRALAVADVNADGKLDVLTADYSANALSVLLGNGDGTFQAIGPLAFAGVYSTGGASNPTALAVADVNGDGKPDVLTANSRNSTAGVLLGNGDGTFQAVSSYPAYDGFNVTTSGLVVADVNADRKPDLLLTNYDADNTAVLLGSGNGTFQAAKNYNAGSFYGSPPLPASPAGLAVADVNGDGKPDLLTANFGSSTAGVLLGTGTGTFQPVVEFTTGPYTKPISLAVADVNGDGRPDVLTANYIVGTVSVLLNKTAYTPLAGYANASAAATAMLVPNPATNYTTLVLNGLPTVTAQIQAVLCDATGRAVSPPRLIAAVHGDARAEIPTAGLATGFYIMRLLAFDAQGQLAGSLPTQRLSVH